MTPPDLLALASRVEVTGIKALSIKRITLEIEDDVTAEEARDILDAVFAKIGACWADTTAGPIHREDGKHVANCHVERVPFALQIARTLDESTISDADVDAALRHGFGERFGGNHP